MIITSILSLDISEPSKLVDEMVETYKEANHYIVK